MSRVTNRGLRVRAPGRHQHAPSCYTKFAKHQHRYSAAYYDWHRKMTGKAATIEQQEAEQRARRQQQRAERKAEQRAERKAEQRAQHRA